MGAIPDPARVLADFQPTRNFLVGIDSDGCAFDSMELKQKECFTPNTIRYWNLQAISKYAREAAEFVNLYSRWRGGNRWKQPMANEVPWYVHEVPTVFVSLNYTAHLHDATMVKCYINAYHNNPETIRQVIDKIMGLSSFQGTPNDLVWTEKWQAKL